MHTSLLQLLNPRPPSVSSAATSPSGANSASSTSSSSGGASSISNGTDLTQTFLQLLSVQLENQSPLDPVDPNQFTTQLATFDSLGELTQIQGLMQTLVNDASGTSGSSSGASANAVSNANLNSISH
jgi:flagellar basal-body rod modification protein FlgD